MKAYSNCIGLINVYTMGGKDGLEDWAERLPFSEVGEAWIEYAFTQASIANKRDWRYVAAILKRGERDGWPPPDSEPLEAPDEEEGTLEERQMEWLRELQEMEMETLGYVISGK